MNTAYLPPCCSPLKSHWPLPHSLPALQLISTTFTPELLGAADFSRCAIEPVRGVAKRQAEYLAGRLCAREALRRLTGIATTPACGEDRAPQWPLGVVGSITPGSGNPHPSRTVPPGKPLRRTACAAHQPDLLAQGKPVQGALPAGIAALLLSGCRTAQRRRRQ